jgi:hypothetical protein
MLPVADHIIALNWELKWRTLRNGVFSSVMFNWSHISPYIRWSLSSQSIGVYVGSTENILHGIHSCVSSQRTQKTQLPLLLHVGPCLQSCCLATICIVFILNDSHTFCPTFMYSESANICFLLSPNYSVYSPEEWLVCEPQVHQKQLVASDYIHNTQ